MIFSWQKAQWQQLWQAKQNNRLPHALLFTGIAGTGKLKFADNFLHLLLCTHATETGTYCDHCHDCQLIKGKVHPNVLWIEPEKSGQAIKVDQIRVVAEFTQQTSLQGRYRIVVIHPAHAMNINAANALLKTLEEPAPDSIIVLVGDQRGRIPATILSRCQRVLFPIPKLADALPWLSQQLSDAPMPPALLLKITHGAPLTALQLAQSNGLDLRRDLFEALSLLLQKQGDPLYLAAKLQEHDITQILQFSLSWMRDLLCMQLNVGTENIINSDYESQLTVCVPCTDIKNNVKFMSHIQHINKQIHEGINLNKQLLIESLLIHSRGAHRYVSG